MTQNHRLLLSLAIALAALVLLVAALPSLIFYPGGPFPFRIRDWFFRPSGGAMSEAPGTLLDLLALVFCMVGLLSVIIGLILRKTRREMIRRLIAAGVLFALAYWFLNLVRRGRRVGMPPEPELPGPQIDQGDQAIGPPSFVTNPPELAIWLFGIILIALLGAIFWFLWRRARPEEQVNTLEQIAQEAETALGNLRAGADLHNAVLRCYAEMSRIISEQRQIHFNHTMTAREFERHLAAAGVQDAHIHQLTRLFERVRYGADAPSASDEHEAVVCLTAIADTYKRPV